jgi:hypothetical protein
MVPIWQVEDGVVDTTWLKKIPEAYSSPTAPGPGQYLPSNMFWEKLFVCTINDNIKSRKRGLSLGSLAFIQLNFIYN